MKYIPLLAVLGLLCIIVVSLVAWGDTPPTPASHSENIEVTFPQPNASVPHHLVVIGQAKGPWFFEASFPVHLKDASGNIIISAPAQAQEEWMTEQFVPFRAELIIPNEYHGPATVILEKDNPSGLAEHTEQVGIPITVK